MADMLVKLFNISMPVNEEEKLLENGIRIKRALATDRSKIIEYSKTCGGQDYSDEVIGYNNIGSGITFIDAPKHKFVQLYKCKNPEYGKCGYAEPLGVNGTYNLEEGLKNSNEGLVYLDNRYIFVYDSAAWRTAGVWLCGWFESPRGNEAGSQPDL